MEDRSYPRKQPYWRMLARALYNRDRAKRSPYKYRPRAVSFRVSLVCYHLLILAQLTVTPHENFEAQVFPRDSARSNIRQAKAHPASLTVA